MTSVSSLHSTFLGQTSSLHSLTHLEQGSFFDSVNTSQESEERQTQEELSSMEARIASHPSCSSLPSTATPSSLKSPLWRLKHLPPGSLFAHRLFDGDDEAQQTELPHQSPPPGFESQQPHSSPLPAEESPEIVLQELASPYSAIHSVKISPTFYQLIVQGQRSPYVISPQIPGYIFCPISRAPEVSPTIPRYSPRQPDASTSPMSFYPPHIVTPTPQYPPETQMTPPPRTGNGL